MDDELNQKAAFAALLLKYKNEPQAAMLAADVLYPNDVKKQLDVAWYWPKDEHVVNTIKELQGNGFEMSQLPTKADVLRRIWELAGSDAFELKDRVAALKLYADMSNMIEKTPAVAVQVNNNRVMVVKEFGDSWQQRAIEQQAGLLEVSETRH